jgi:hypothetical protein
MAMTNGIADVSFDGHLSSAKLALFWDGKCVLIISMVNVYSVGQMLLSLLADSNTILLHNPLYSVSTMSGYPKRSPGIDQKNGSLRFQTQPIFQSAISWRARAGPIPDNPRVLPSLARPIGSYPCFWVSGFSIDGRIQISYCKLQNVTFGILLSYFYSLAAFTIRNTRDMLPGQS